MLTILGAGLTIAVGAYIILCGLSALNEEVKSRKAAKKPAREIVEDNSEIGSVEK